MSTPPPALLTTRVAGMVLTEREFTVPLDHDDPRGATLTVFAREVAAPGGQDRPYLLYLQGGPGQEAPRPTGSPVSPGWLGRALEEYRVLLLDQRGTGRSTPVGLLPGMTPGEQAAYLAHFRADAIVRDAEHVRRELGVGRWSLLGQSFGGFCAMTYLSRAPEALREVFFTGGLPPVGRHPDDNYAATYTTLRERNRRHYARYPGDLDRVRALQGRLEAGEVVLPTGEPLTVRRFRQLGHLLGTHDGSERLHHLLEREPGDPAFVHDVAAALPFSARNPLYVVLHEACVADGHATRWSAERTMPEDFAADPALFTGEHVHPAMFDDHPALAPLREAAGLLADREWPRLYDEERLRACGVPCAAAVYADDAYVDRALSEETARLLPGLRVWLTNEYEHDALRVDGARVLDRLMALARGEA